jgi:ribosomal protein S18 acetylase RimI-like enzyme
MDIKDNLDMSIEKIDPINDLALRDCSSDDLIFVHDLLIKNTGIYIDKYWGGWDDKLFWEKTNKDSIVILEYHGQKIAFFDRKIEEGVMHIMNIDVAEEFLKQGIGSFILSLIEKEAYEAKARKIALEVFTDNPSVSLYERNGFEKVCTDGKPIIKDDCFSMEKLLD